MKYIPWVNQLSAEEFLAFPEVFVAVISNLPDSPGLLLPITVSETMLLLYCLSFLFKS